MKFEKIGKRYYVNGEQISLAALEAIFTEIWDVEDFAELYRQIITDGVTNVEGWDGHLIVGAEKENSVSEKERAEISAFMEKLIQVSIKAAKYDSLVSAMKTA